MITLKQNLVKAFLQALEDLGVWIVVGEVVLIFRSLQVQFKSEIDFKIFKEWGNILKALPIPWANSITTIWQLDTNVESQDLLNQNLYLNKISSDL